MSTICPERLILHRCYTASRCFGGAQTDRTDRSGAFNAYQRDPYTGEELRVSTEDWGDAPILPGEDLAFPPIYLLKSEFEAWLRRLPDAQL
jgi:hypothetical protein